MPQVDTWLDLRREQGCQRLPMIEDPFTAFYFNEVYTRIAAGLLDARTSVLWADIHICGRTVEAERDRIRHERAMRKLGR